MRMTARMARRSFITVDSAQCTVCTVQWTVYREVSVSFQLNVERLVELLRSAGGEVSACLKG
jgi:hypothetical protein